MIFYDSRYCAIDIADHIEEVEITPSGSLFGLWKQRARNTLICRMKPGKWTVLGRIKTLNPTLQQQYAAAGLSLEFNPIILCKRK